MTERIPEFDRSIARSRDDLAIVGREGDAEYVFLVSDEASRCVARVEVPKAKRRVPRTRESELAVRRDDEVRDEVIVAA